MHKKDLLLLREIYISHIKWHTTVQALHQGYPLYDKSVEKNYKKTDLGKWIKNQSDFFKNEPEYKKLVILNKQIHAIYHKILYLEKKVHNSFLSFFTSTQEEDKDLLKRAYLKDLSKKSKEILKTIKSLESKFITYNK